MNLATWNLDHCRAATVWPVLQRNHSVDLLFLQECPDLKIEGAAWCATPRDWGKITPWGSAVLPARGRIEPVEIDGYTGWVTGGFVLDSGLERDERPLLAFSVHAPSRSDTVPRDEYVEEVRTIVRRIGHRWPTSSTDLILAGDFNFRSLGERQQGEVLQTTELERETLAEFSALGLVSCWAKAHPNASLPQTLRWTRNRSTPYHCDGIFIPNAWATGVSCEVSTSTEYAGASDHYPMIASVGTNVS